MPPIRWGILGTGRIAGKMADALRGLEDASLTAVGSRSEATATAFASRYGIARSYGSYEALAADAELDVVYIATPHTLHAENTLLCLEHGKSVLCEKPFCLNALEATRMIDTARAQGLFLMEAMWSRFLPIMVKLRSLLAEGAIGEVRMLEADFGFRNELDPKSRLFDPTLGGGALLDVGVYALSFASMVMGQAESISGMAALGTTGVDEQNAMILRHAGHRLSLLSSAVRTGTKLEANLYGTEGRIRIHRPWYRAQGLTLYRGRKRSLLGLGRPVFAPHFGNGFRFQAQEVMGCLREGKLASPIMPLEETLHIMATMDALRSQWGLRYPSERQG